MKKLFDFFDKVFLINLDSRLDRLHECNSLFEQYNVIEQVERVSAIKLPNNNNYFTDKIGSRINSGAMGLTLTMAEIFKTAKKNKYKNILVLEDDFIMKNGEYVEQILLQLKTLSWDVLYLGANLHEKLSPVTENLYRIKSAYATHSVAYNETFYDYFLKNFEENNIGIIDVWLYNFAQKDLNCFCCWPILSLQRPSYSDIECKFSDYDWMEINYYKNTKNYVGS